MAANTQSQMSTDISNYKNDPEPDRQAIANVVQDLVDSYDQRELSITVGAESADDIDLTIQVVDADGSTDVSEQHTLRLECYDADALPAANTAFRFTAVGTGTATSDLNEAALILDTDSNGKAVVTLTDQGGASDQDVYVESDAFSKRVDPELTTVTFDAS